MLDGLIVVFVTDLLLYSFYYGFIPLCAKLDRRCRQLSLAALLYHHHEHRVDIDDDRLVIFPPR